MSRSPILAAVALAVTTAACGAEFHPYVPRGLTVHQVNANKVTGSFATEGTAVRFELVYDGESRVATFADADGNPLVQSALVAGVETTQILGALAITDGPSLPAAQLDGDRGALDALAQLPESKLIGELHGVLATTGIRPDLYTAPAIDGATTGRCAVTPWSWWWSTECSLPRR